MLSKLQVLKMAIFNHFFKLCSRPLDFSEIWNRTLWDSGHENERIKNCSFDFLDLKKSTLIWVMFPKIQNVIKTTQNCLNNRYMPSKIFFRILLNIRGVSFALNMKTAIFLLFHFHVHCLKGLYSKFEKNPTVATKVWNLL